MLFTPPALAKAFTATARIERMLGVEAALARAQARTGVIPGPAAETIAHACRADAYDVESLHRAATDSGNLAIPLVSALTRRVGESDGNAKGWVHWGATSQDIIDTGLVLQLREGLSFVESELERLCDALATQADAHRHTVLAGRTWLQQASPVTLGCKLAACLSALDRDRARLDALKPRLLVVQLGGAAGNLASLGDRGIAVTEALAAELGLGVPDTPWHTQRDRFCECASTLGILTASLGKLARDLALLAQTEVGEAFEPSAPGRGGSSTMPQKRNPVGAAVVLRAATRVPGLVATMLTAAVQEHERGLGNWPAEWDTLPQIVQLCGSAVFTLAQVVSGLDVNAARMRANIDLTQGQLFAEAVQMALAPRLGRDVAHKLVADVCRRAAAEARHVRDVLAETPQARDALDASALQALFDPLRYLGSNDAYIDRVLKGRR
ncbi:MAG TPA: 3-carboxy-cis,cis-muconate cycloisomerase [Casimicrobiaceae bacterium]